MARYRNMEVSIIDKKTGDPVEGEGRLMLLQKDREKCRVDWYRTYPKGDDWLAETDLSREAMKVLLAMRGSLQYENIVGRSQADVAKRLMMPQPNVSKAVKELIENGFLEELPPVGRRKRYRMSHFIGWRGSMKSEREFLAGETATLKIGGEGDNPCQGVDEGSSGVDGG